ncbi:hypothetical protein NFD60_13200 (plasmid) [Staphylococcus epidermidis]|nr:hypothetical protein NFD60_13200 [Staphylococcus epidermidis]
MYNLQVKTAVTVEGKKIERLENEVAKENNSESTVKQSKKDKWHITGEYK